MLDHLADTCHCGHTRFITCLWYGGCRHGFDFIQFETTVIRKSCKETESRLPKICTLNFILFLTTCSRVSWDFKFALRWEILLCCWRLAKMCSLSHCILLFHNSSPSSSERITWLFIIKPLLSLLHSWNLMVFSRSSSPLSELELLEGFSKSTGSNPWFLRLSHLLYIQLLSHE